MLEIDITFIGMMILGSACFAVMFQVPRRFFLLAVAVGVLSGTGPRLFAANMNASLVTFIVAFAVGCVCNGIARFSGSPAQGLLIPGVIFLVPGAKVYQAFTAAITQESSKAGLLMVEAALVTVAISFGLLIANWLVPVRRTL